MRPLRRVRRVVGGGRWCADAAVPAPSGRWTALHWAAGRGYVGVAAELLVGGADQNITNPDGYAVPPTATRRPHADRCRETPRQRAQGWNKLGEYDAAVAQARPPHRAAARARSSRFRAPRRRRHRRACHTRHACTGAACRGRVLRRTPTRLRRDLRVALRAIRRGHRTAGGRVRTYRVAAHSEGAAAHAALTGT